MSQSPGPSPRSASRRILVFNSTVLAVVLALMPSAFADQVTLEPSQDNSLFESPTGGLSNGQGVHLFLGTTFQDPSLDFRRALVQFDIAGNVPAGSVITKVELSVNVSKTISGDNPAGLHPVLQAWGEGGSDAGGPEGRGDTAQNGDATWLHTFLNQGPDWNTPGGDYNPVASATTMLGFNGPYTWDSTAELVADVQGWLDNPAGNFGWAIIGNEALTGSAKRIDSRENGTPNNRPRLVIDFCPPEDATWANYGTGHPGTNGVPSFTAANDPILCAPLTLNIGNSSGATTNAFLFLGFVSAQLPTGLDGELLLLPNNVIPFLLPGAGVSLPGDVPCDAGICGVDVFMQVLQSDAGASQGVSFSEGLQLHFGTF